MSGPSSREEASARWRPRLLAIGLALVATALIAALVVLVQHSNTARDRALAHKQHSFNVVVLTSEVDGSLARAEAALGRYVTDGDPATGTLYYDEWRHAGQELDALRGLVSDSPTQSARADRLKQLYVVRADELNKPMVLANYKRGWAALSLFSKAGQSETLPQIRRLLRDIAEQERALLDARSTAADESVDKSNLLVAWLSVAGVLLVLSLGAIGWLAVNALAAQRVARAVAEEESDRSLALERAVAERTAELSTANLQLVHEGQVRAEAEARLRQVQKMDAVGQLTGGIAHDFNNMLAVVLGGLELAKRRVEEQTAEAIRHIDNATEGATRAAALTRRLLTFSRAEPLLPSATDPATLIAGMAELIDRTIGERIDVQTHAAPDIWPVWVDPYQLENAILNLCVNARDAMEGAGVLRIEAQNVPVAAGAIGQLGPGDYVRIAVIDQGQGMSPEILERVFEPFFTTKPVGQGTGLGLSQIFGFARQSGGDVTISSVEGKGTTAALYLPRHTGEVRAEEDPSDDLPEETAAGGVVLVVEDDARVRTATGEALVELGYQPILCSSADEAIATLAERIDIRLLMTDVVMPDTTGPELVQRIAPDYPDLPILFVTGYVGEAGEAESFAGHAVLRKPYTLAKFAKALAEAIRAGEPKRTKARA